MEKVIFLREECGFDIAFDYKVNPVTGLSGLDVSFSLNGMFIFLLTMIRTGPNNPDAGKGSKPTGPRKVAV